MFLPWKNLRLEKSKKNDALMLQQVQLVPQDEAFVSFNTVVLAPHIFNLNCKIPFGAWVLLEGTNELAKALFLDLCFQYISPDKGSIQPRLSGSDLSFLGRSYTTYGNTLVEHLGSGAKENSKALMEFIIEKVFSSDLKKRLGRGKKFILDVNKNLLDFELNEKEYMEIAEANLLLQKRPAAIVDTTSDFYKTALEQGFQHSELFLNSGKTIFWITNGEEVAGLRTHDVLRFYFPEQSPATYIN